MKILRGGRTFIIPSWATHPFRSEDFFAEHGFLIGYNQADWPGGQKGLGIVFDLLSQPLTQYCYFKTDLATVYFYTDVLVGIKSVNGLSGGQFFNKVVRYNLVGIDGILF